MKSKWSHLKPVAISLRKQGKSIGVIESELGIPRSTLSGWFKSVTLTEKQRKKLKLNRENGLKNARKGATKWHNEQKAQRLELAKKESLETLAKIETGNTETLELAMAVLYLAEGSKKNVETAIGSSDPRTLRFFIKGLEKVFKYDIGLIRCELYLRADQDGDKLKKYWSKELNLSLSNFKQVSYDKRSAGTKTYDSYKGVCSLRCGQVAIRRRLVYLAEEYFDIIGRQ